MKIISNHQLLDKNFYQNKSFDRLRSALSEIDNIDDNIAYNIVDSVIFIKNPKSLIDNGGLKKIYNTVLVNSSTEIVNVKVGEITDTYTGYSDISDFMYAPTSSESQVNPGETVIFDINEPYYVEDENLPRGLVLAYVSKYNGIK